MGFRIVDTFTDGLARLSGEELKRRRSCRRRIRAAAAVRLGRPHRAATGLARVAVPARPLGAVAGAGADHRAAAAAAAARPARRALLWVGILSLFYFSHGVAEAWSSHGERWLALLEVALTVLLISLLGAGVRRPPTPAETKP